MNDYKNNIFYLFSLVTRSSNVIGNIVAHLFFSFFLIFSLINIFRIDFLLLKNKINYFFKKLINFSLFKNELASLLTLELISAFIYRKWLSFSYFISGDYHWIPAETLSYLKTPTAWTAFLTTGEPNWVMWSGYSTGFFGLLGSIGLDSNISMNIFVLCFIALIAPIISFFFLRRFTKKIFTAFIFSFLLLFNTYVLTNIIVGHLLLSVSFYIALASFIFYSLFVESGLRKTHFLVISTLIIWIAGIVDFRVFYIFSISFAIYQVFYLIINKTKVTFSNLFYKNFIFVLLVILLNFNWVLPTFFIGEKNFILERPIFGKGLIDLFNSLSGTYYYWSLSHKVIWGVNTGFPVVFMLLPLAVLLVLYFSNKKKELLVFLILFLLGSFLGKQNTAPFSRVYEFLFAKFPGFSAFRDSTKFFQVTIFSLTILLSMGYESIKKQIVKNILVAIVMLISFLNLFSLVKYQNHMFVPAKIPDYYQDLFNLKSDKFERVLWIPRHEAIRTGTALNPRLSLMEIKNDLWYSVLSEDQKSDKTNDVMNNKNLEPLLAMSSVKYLFVPQQLQVEDPVINDDAFYYEDYRPEIIDILNSKDWLKKRYIKSSTASIYETKISRPHFYITNDRETFNNMFDLKATEVQSNFINPSYYLLHLNNISGPVYLTFTDTYSKKWFLGPHFKSILNFATWKETEKQKSNKYYNEANGNVFKIDKEFLIDFSNDFKVNEDGSINAVVSLYYGPQKELVLGTIVTVVTVILIVVYFVVFLYKKHKLNIKDK